jgi:hypothetical protein
LVSELSRKREFVLVIKMTEFQKHLYMRCLEALSQKSGSGKIKLFSGFQELLRVWNHPGNAVINWATRSQREELKKANTKGKSSSSADNASKLFSLKFIANELKPVLEYGDRCDRGRSGLRCRLF